MKMLTGGGDGVVRADNIVAAGDIAGIDARRWFGWRIETEQVVWCGVKFFCDGHQIVQVWFAHSRFVTCNRRLRDTKKLCKCNLVEPCVRTHGFQLLGEAITPDFLDHFYTLKIFHFGIDGQYSNLVYCPR